ncbi:aldo/keto reductase [Klebsiella pneumoniae]|uniref:aldo/keto reductase n=1 Tax=Klebsiella pneumoniae TaxID=573 RepID=UPI00312EEC81
MKYVNLGRSGLKVSRLCLGCMSYGEPERLPQPWSLDEKASRPLIRQALEAGINFFDTANTYSDGSSEEITGKALIELGVSASALSHALKGLETRLGVRLLNRTTKSVTPTAAGEELVQSVLQPFDTIEGALESLNRYRNTPTGRIRINAAVEAANLLLAPVMPAFMDRYPDIEIDIVASNRMVDVTDAGFDAGIRYGGTVPEDMVARRLSADIRWVIAASPDYLERYGTPEHPDDLLHHRCISNRLGDDRVYRWELARDGETYQMTVPGSVTVNHAETGLVAVLGGAGLMYFPEPLVAPYVKDGRLRLVLTEWSPLEEGFHIYYSSRRQLPTGLRLLIEFIQEARPLGL